MERRRSKGLTIRIKARWVCCAVLLCACGRSLPPAARAPADPPLPRTQRDPLPYAPAKTRHPETGAPTGVALSGGHEQARRVALRLVRAMLRQDAAELREVFARRVIGTRSGRTMQRRDIVAECLAHAKHLQWDAELSVDSVVDLKGLETRRVGTLEHGEPKPEGLRPADVVVLMPLRPLGPPPPARCFQRSFHSAQFYVRTGPEPRIIAVYP